MAVKIGIIGNGWRTHAFLEIILQLPDKFQLSGIFVRNPDKAAAFDKRFADVVFTDKEEFYCQAHDFVVVAVPRSVVLTVCEEVFAHGHAVLCETPPAADLTELSAMWALKNRYRGKIQVLEQYFLQPYHSALLQIVTDNTLGNVSNASLSMMHDYHGISMLRKLLGADMAPCEIDAKLFTFPVTLTCGRDGRTTAGEVRDNSWRKRATFTFANGKTGFYDFCDEQYFNDLRSRHANVQGDRGEIYDQSVCYLNEANQVVKGTIVRDDKGQYSNLEGYYHDTLTLNGKTVFQNPYPIARLTDDEIAIARMFEGMATYVKTGKEIYPLADALQDTYLFLLMDESMQSNTPVSTTTQPWHIAPSE